MFINFFSHKLKSYDEFIRLAKEGRKKVTIEPYLEIDCPGGAISSSPSANFCYMAKFATTMLNGRKIIYHEILLKKISQESVLIGIEERRSIAITLFLLADKKLKELLENNPDLVFELIGLNNEPIEEQVCRQFFQEAEKQKINI